MYEDAILPDHAGDSYRGYDAVVHAARIREVTLELERVFSTGGYHNAMAYPTMDNIAAAMADLCLLADRHTSKLLDGRYSLLPDQLQQGEGYLGCLGMVQVGYAEEARRAAQLL